MKNLRNKNQPAPVDTIDTYLSTSWDKVLTVYNNLADLIALADAYDAGDLTGYVKTVDIDTLAELNAILLDATLGDSADFATAAQGAKVDLLTVTGPVDLDTLNIRVNDLDAAVILRGGWSPVGGSFPGGGTAQAGDSYIVSAGGAVDGVDFFVNDRIVAITDNASTTTYASNWLKLDYTDQVLSVATLTGAISAADLRTQLNVEDGATADQTDAEIRAAVEAATDSNVFTDADHSKLDGIEAGATADQTDAEIETAYNNQVSVVTQVEAEAGVATTVRRWTAERVKQAIDALASGLYGKYDATVDPAVGDDSADNFVVGSIWINVTADTAWICLDNSLGAAVWTEITQAGGGGGGLTPVFKTGNYTASAGEIVFCDSSGGAFTITLPATPSGTDNVVVVDAGGAATTYNITVGRNGETIDGVAADFVIDQNYGQCNFAYDGVGTDWGISPIGFPDVIDANTVFIVYKAVNYTAQSGERVMVGTDTGAFTITLPATPSAGWSVGVWDADNNAGTNNVTIGRNGSTIDGAAADDTLDVDGGHFEYVYDGTTWKRAFWAPGGVAESSGTFTPTVLDNSLNDSEGQTYTEQTGLYRKIGSVVYFWIDIEVSSLGTLTTSESVKIGGLPFTSSAFAGLYAVTVGYGSALNITAGNAVSGLVSPSATYLNVYKWSATTGSTGLLLSELSADGRLIISGNYVAA